MNKTYAFALLVSALLTSTDSTPLNKHSALTAEDFENGRFLLKNEQTDLTSAFDFSKEVVLNSPNQDVKNGHRYRRWPGATIPYEISSLYTQNERSVIAAAMEEYHSKTCVRFIPHTNEVDFIHITPDDGMGDTISPYCYSYVGKIGRKQFVKMYGECVRLAAMIHELGHVIGFEHEHNRADRDYYINVHWGNIDPLYHYAFDKVNAAEFDTFGLPYDYYSTMHYPDYSFAKPGLKSFTLVYPGDISKENQRLSGTDVQKIQAYYGC